MTNNKSKRVFWFGMHVVLTKTELPRLRALGYEVFNPPYLADVYDQSAVTDWDRHQPTTLPSEVFRELSRYNFFYNRITPRIAELLNEYFGAVIVTISPNWLQSVLEVYHGRVIYRVYGQPGLLTETLWSMRLFRAVQERDDFYFVPHAEAAVRDEHSWLKARMTVVPYTIPLDVFDHEGTWSADEPHANEIMTCCPNIDNPHFAHHYHYLNAHFPGSHIKLYGVQPRPYADPRVVGTLERDEQLSRYRRAAGYWYHYDIPTSCYLPPIEMMTIGGPVIYMRGSLLARNFSTPGPGEAANVDDAKRKIDLLLHRDRGFIEEVRASQRPIVEDYHPRHVHPIFDRAFRHLIDMPNGPPKQAAVYHVSSPPSSGKTVYVLFHVPGEHVEFQGGDYDPVDELARTVKSTVGTILRESNHDVVVTCFADQLPLAMGYLESDLSQGRLRFHPLDLERLAVGPLAAIKTAVQEVRSHWHDGRHQPPADTVNSTQAATSLVRQIQSPRLKRWPRAAALWALECAGQSRLLVLVLLVLARVAMQLIQGVRRTRAWLGHWKRELQKWAGYAWRSIPWQDPWMRRHQGVQFINKRDGNVVVLVPHGSMFPEALLLKKPIVICRPDDASAAAPTGGIRGKMQAAIDRFLTEKATAIVTVNDVMQCAALATNPAATPSAGTRSSRVDQAHDPSARHADGASLVNH